MQIEQRSVRKFNGEVPRERDSRLWWQCVGGVIVGILLVGGFAHAAKQHFDAYGHGLKTVELQCERNRLKVEQKRLLLERENAVSLDELKKKAKKLGLEELSVEHLNALGTTGDLKSPEQKTLKISSEDSKLMRRN